MASLLDALIQFSQQQNPALNGVYGQQPNGVNQIVQGLQGLASSENKPLEHLSKLAGAAPQYYAGQYGAALANTADPDRQINNQFKQAQIAAQNDPFDRFYKLQQLNLGQQRLDNETQKAQIGQLQGLNEQRILQGLPPIQMGVSSTNPYGSFGDVPLNQRNNNPGNLKGADGQFRQFDNPADGLAANLADLQLKIAGDSPVMKSKFGNDYKANIDNVIQTWAPASDNNDPERYAQFVSQKTGIPRNQPLSVEDSPKVLDAIAQFEGGTATTTNPPQPVTNATILPNQDATLNQLRQLAQNNPSEWGKEYFKAKLDAEKDTKKNEDTVITPDNANLTGKPFIDSIPDQDVRNKANALLEGRIPFPTINSRTPTAMKKAVEAAQQADPTFSAANYPIRVQTQKAYTSGQEAKNINAINTVIAHVGDWDKAVSELNNGGYTSLNSLTNTSQRQVDDKFNGKINAAQTAAKAVGSEAAKAYQGVGAVGQEQQKEWQHALSTNLGPESRKQTAKEIGGLLLGKIQALQEQYNQTFPNSNKSFVSPKALKTLKDLGVDTSSIQGPSDELPDTPSKEVNWVVKDGKLVRQ